MAIRGTGKGYWSTRNFKNAPESYEAEDNISVFANDDGDYNILPSKIDGETPSFYELELRVGKGLPIRINGKHVVEPIDGFFKMDDNDLPIRKLEILGTGAYYQAFGKYL